MPVTALLAVMRQCQLCNIHTTHLTIVQVPKTHVHTPNPRQSYAWTLPAACVHPKHTRIYSSQPLCCLPSDFDKANLLPGPIKPWPLKQASLLGQQKTSGGRVGVKAGGGTRPHTCPTCAPPLAHSLLTKTSYATKPQDP
jgi:hypothetical protein